MQKKYGMNIGTNTSLLFVYYYLNGHVTLGSNPKFLVNFRKGLTGPVSTHFS